MYPLMCSQIPTFGERFVALLALVRLLPCMPPHMYLQRARPHEFIPTLITYVGPLPRVPSLVISQVPLRGETHLTVSEVTLKGLQSVMDAHVRE